jgi:5'-nucleotidase
VVESEDPRGRQIFWIGGGQPVWEPIPGTDFHETGSEYISVTPLQLDMTDRRFLDRLQEKRPSWIDAVGGTGD